MFKNKKELLITILIFSLFACGTVFAAPEVKFPEINGISLDGSGFKNTTAYFFSLGAVIGAFISVVIMIVSGIIILFSKGNPGRIEDSRRRIFGALFGLLILGGLYVIINFINSRILDVKEVEERTEIIDSGPNGVYMKDEDGKEIFLKVSTPNLTAQDFNQKASSFTLNQPTEKDMPKYGAIFFSDSEYQGQCYYSSNGGTSNGSAPFKIGSVYIFRTTGGNGNPVKIINNDNGSCQNLNKTKKAFYPKTIDVSLYGEPFRLEENGHWIESGSILLENNDVLVLLETRDKEICPERDETDNTPPQCPHCQIIVKTAENETCYPLKYNYAYNPDSVNTIKPGYVTLFTLVSQ